MVTQSHEWSGIPPSQNDGVDLRDVVSRLWRARRLLAASAAAGLVIGLGSYLGSAPVYQADALLQLESKSGILSLPAALSAELDSDPHTVTEIELLRSRMVLGEAVERLNLDWRIEPQTMPLIGTMLARRDLPLPDAGFLRPYARRGDEVTLEALQVPETWLGRVLLLTAGRDGAYEVELPDGRRLAGEVGKALVDPDSGLILQVGKLAIPEGRRVGLAQTGRAAAIAALRQKLSVSETTRQSLMLRLTYTDRSPREAERVLDAIAQAYLRQNINRSSAEAASSLAFVEKNLPEAERAVTAAGAALNEFRKANQAIDLNFEVQAMLSQIGTLKAQLDGITRDEQAIRQRYTPNHPIYRQMVADKQHAEEQIEALQGQIARLPGKQLELVKLTGALEAAQSAYMQLSGRAQELRVLQASKIGNVRIVDSASAPGSPIAPNFPRSLLMWMMIGLVASATVVLIRAWLNAAITRIAEIQETGLPVFSVIRFVPRLASARSARRREIMTVSQPSDPVAESFRSMRTALHLRLVGAKNRVVLVTSATPDVGKSFCSENLAAVAAMAGQKVCLIDGDLRRGTTHQRFGVKRSHPGLASHLAGQATLDEVLVKGGLEGLWMIPGGPLPHNPSELLMGGRLPALLETLGQRFDLVIVDSPPALTVTDPVLIGKSVGAALIVARHNVTTVPELAAVKGLMIGAGVQVMGAVLNCFDPRRSSESYGSAYSRYYDYASTKT